MGMKTTRATREAQFALIQTSLFCAGIPFVFPPLCGDKILTIDPGFIYFVTNVTSL